MAPRGPVGARDLHKVFVRGTTGLREADLSSTFSKFDEIVSIRSHSKGYSFVTFETTQGAADSLGVNRVKDQAVECHLAWMQETPIPNLQNANLPPRPGSWGGYGARDELRSEGGRNLVEGDDHGSRRGRSRSRSRDRHRRRRRRSTSGSRERRRRGEDDRDSGRRERRRRRSRSRSGSPGHRRRRDRGSIDRSELDGSPRERRRSHSPRRRRHSRSRSPRRRRPSSPTRRGSPSQSLRGSSTKSGRSRARSRDPLTPQSDFSAESRDGGRKSGRRTSLERARAGEDGDGDTSMERNGGEEEEPPATAPFVDETCCLAVRNLSKVCTADSLHSLASECGQVASAVVHHYYTGEGMLVYETGAEAEEALHMLNGRQLHGLTLRLQREALKADLGDQSEAAGQYVACD